MPRTSALASRYAAQSAKNVKSKFCAIVFRSQKFQFNPNLTDFFFQIAFHNLHILIVSIFDFRLLSF